MGGGLDVTHLCHTWDPHPPTTHWTSPKAIWAKYIVHIWEVGWMSCAIYIQTQLDCVHSFWFIWTIQSTSCFISSGRCCCCSFYMCTSFQWPRIPERTLRTHKGTNPGHRTRQSVLKAWNTTTGNRPLPICFPLWCSSPQKPQRTQ